VRLRSLAAAPLALLLLAVAAVPALAADPPADVVFDGTVTVVFVDVHVPLEGGSVTLISERQDLGEDGVLQELEGTIDASGSAVFSAVARPAEGAPPVTLRASAHLDETVVEDGCLTAWSYDGSSEADGALEVTMVLEVDAASSLVCEKILPGSIIGPDGDGFPVEAASVRLVVEGRDGVAGEFLIDEAGDFRVKVPMWDPALGARVTLKAVSPVTRTEPLPDDCEATFALVARYEWTLEDPFTMPDPVSVSAAEESVGSVCGPATATPRPTKTPGGAAPTEASGPSITLPPTDTPDGLGGAGSGGVGLVLTLVAVLATMIVALGSAVRISRRGS